MPNMDAISPCFPVPDVGATIRWYEEHLGFQGDPFPEKEPFVFAMLTRDGIEIMLQLVDGYQKPDLYASRAGGVWSAYIRMEGVTEFYESVREEVEILQPLRQQPYGTWEFEVKDLNGYILVFSE
jgi:uncharacterized glyoxalase superfamily protein PhnB